MEKSNYEFVYQSRLQFVCEIILLFAGLAISVLPIFMIDYLENHTDYTFTQETLISLIFIPTFVIVPLWSYLWCKIYYSWKRTGFLHLYNSYATLELGGRTLMMKKDEFDIGSFCHRDRVFWNIYIDRHTHCFGTSGKLKCFKVSYDTSLSEAMTALEESGLPTMLRESTKIKNFYSRYGIKKLRIGKTVIPMGVSTSEAFANTPYYVDYHSCFPTKGSLTCICLVRELSDPEHVVGSVRIVCEGNGEAAKTESILSRCIVSDGYVIDKRIKVEESSHLGE